MCGAALLISGRAHGFNRTINEIAKVVHCHPCTIKKRLLEFKNTPASLLTFDHFMSINFENSQDPPSYKKAHTKDKEYIDNFCEANNNEKLIEKQLSKKKNNQVFDNNLTEIASAALKTATPETATPKATTLEAAISEVSGNISDVLSLLKSNGYIKKQIDESIDNDLDVVHYVKKSSCDVKINEDNDDEITLYNIRIDDDEIDSYILSKEKHEIKKKLWMKVHGDTLLSRKKLNSKNPKVNKDKQKKAENSVLVLAKSTVNAMEPILKKKKLSSKINYDILNSLDSLSTNIP